MAKKNYSIGSVKRAMQILRLFTQENSELGITEIAQQLNMSKSSVHRLIATLTEENFLEQNVNNSRYQLGLKILDLSGIVHSNLKISREAIPHLESLVEDLGEASHISILEGREIVYLHKIECKHPVRLLSHVGKRNPASCTSAGKVILAYQEEVIIQQVLDLGLPLCGPNSVIDPALFLQQLEAIRSEGYTVCIDELHEGAVSFAAPIRDYTGDVIAAVSVVGLKQRVEENQYTDFIQAVMKTGEKISQQLGFYP